MARLRFDARVHASARRTTPSGRSTSPATFDQASERRQDLVELIERGYDDAGRQFIEPVVGASGDLPGAGAQAR